MGRVMDQKNKKEEHAQQEHRPRERQIHLMCQLQLECDVTLVVVPHLGANPEEIALMAGLDLTLVDDAQIFCATKEGCGNGPLVRIDGPASLVSEKRYLGKSVVIPARFLKLHPNVL